MDIEVSREIAAAPAAISRLMFDPRRDADWMGNARLREVPHQDWLSPGTRISREGILLGRKLEWTTRIEEHVPDRLLRFAFVEGPIGGEVSYLVEPAEQGARVTIHDHSEYSFTVMSWMIRQQLNEDLDRLARLVEGAGSPAGLEPASELDPWGSEPD